MLMSKVGQTRRRRIEKRRNSIRCARCRREKCERCERLSLPARTSPFWICCACRELNRRAAVAPPLLMREVRGEPFEL